MTTEDQLARLCERQAERIGELEAALEARDREMNDYVGGEVWHHGLDCMKRECAAEKRSAELLENCRKADARAYGFQERMESAEKRLALAMGVVEAARVQVNALFAPPDIDLQRAATEGLINSVRACDQEKKP